MLYDFLIANISRFLGAEWDAIETAIFTDFSDMSFYNENSLRFFGNEFSLFFSTLMSFAFNNQRPQTIYP